MFRKIIAAVLDFLTIFIIAGVGVAYFTGGLTESGFSLEGLPALAVFAIIIAYFVVFTKYLGGTLWRRVLGVGR
jgi:hypothetical protein